MIKFVVSTVLSVVGIGLIAAFGSLTLGSELARDLPTISVGEAQYHWMVYGLIAFLVGELISLTSDRLSWHNRTHVCRSFDPDFGILCRILCIVFWSCLYLGYGGSKC